LNIARFPVEPGADHPTLDALNAQIFTNAPQHPGVKRRVEMKGVKIVGYPELGRRELVAACERIGIGIVIERLWIAFLAQP
jgi:hypothetical protein